MAIHGIHHPALNVHDLDAALTFWTEVVGAELVERDDDVAGSEADQLTACSDVSAAMAMIRIGSNSIELIEYRNPAAVSDRRTISQTGWSHVCLLSDDAERDLRRLVRAGCVTRSPLVDIGDGQVCYLDDPWGNMLEIWEVPTRAPATGSQ
jgi:catechol 2,3-dioxygenase-like lactoylglutathione lyase family enzyme